MNELIAINSCYGIMLQKETNFECNIFFIVVYHSCSKEKKEVISSQAVKKVYSPKKPG